MRLIQRTAIGLALLTALSTTAAGAQEASGSNASSGTGFGVKVGFGIDPGQFVGGLQYALGENLGIFRMVPNAHVGIGNETTFDVNMDFLLRLLLADSNVAFYGGAAPSLFFGNNTHFGGNLIVGTQLPLSTTRATNVEARFGLGKVPDFRLLVTFLF